MKKSIGLISAVMLSTIMFTGCESMSANEQRIGAAALGGAVGGGVGNKVGGGVGAALGGGGAGGNYSTTSEAIGDGGNGFSARSAGPRYACHPP